MSNVVSPQIAVAALFGGLAAVFLYNYIGKPPKEQQVWEVTMHRKRTNRGLETTDEDAPQERFGGNHMAQQFGANRPICWTKETQAFVSSW